MLVEQVVDREAGTVEREPEPGPEERVNEMEQKLEEAREAHEEKKDEDPKSSDSGATNK